MDHQGLPLSPASAAFLLPDQPQLPGKLGPQALSLVSGPTSALEAGIQAGIQADMALAPRVSAFVGAMRGCGRKPTQLRL